MKNALREMQTLRAGGGAENFRSAADPVPGGTGRRPKFNQLEMVTTFTWSLPSNKPSLVRKDTRNFELSR